MLLAAHHSALSIRLARRHQPAAASLQVQARRVPIAAYRGQHAAATVQEPLSCREEEEEEEEALPAWQEDTSSRAEAESHDEDLLALLPEGMSFPLVRYQKPLDAKERKAYHADADEKARQKKLMITQVGAKGLTKTLLASCMRMLLAHSLIRVRLGEGCGLERTEARRFLEEVLDAAGVAELGHTVTLFRRKALPTPSSFPDLHGPPRAAPSPAMPNL